MAGNESKLWNKWSQSKSFKHYFPKAVRVEDRGEITFPDVAAVLRGNPSQIGTNISVTVLVELKHVEIKKDRTFKIKWRNGQPAFLSSWVRAGGRAAVLVQVQQRALALLWPQPNAQWIQWVQGSGLTLSTLSEMPLNATVVEGMNFDAVNQALHHYFFSQLK